MHDQSSKTSGSRNRVSGFLRLFVLSLLTAAFSFTSLHAQTVAYITNAGDPRQQNGNTVSVMDTSSNTVNATITVGDNPKGVVFSPDSTRAYVANEANGVFPMDSSISVIDTASNTVVATIASFPDGGPVLPAITPDGKNLYVPQAFDNSVLVVSTATNSVVATIPIGMASFAIAITPDGAHAYVLSPGFVSVIATATNTVSAGPIAVQSSIISGPFLRQALAITPAGDAVYVASGFNNNVVSVISTATNTVSATVVLPDGTFQANPYGVAITPDGSRVYVTDNNNNNVDVIDTATNTLEPSPIPVGSGPIGVAVTPDGSSIYVANSFDFTVSVISTATNTVVATAPANTDFTQPWGIAFTTLGSAISICPTVITQPGTYRLANDLHCFNTDGIDIRADNVTLMLGGHTITQDSAHFGLVHQGVSAGVGLAAGSTNVHIFGPGTITGFQGGVVFEQVSNSMVKNVTSTRNFFGFNVNGGFSAGCGTGCPSNGNIYDSNTATFNNQHGFTLNGAANNIFHANNSSHNLTGFLLFVATGNDVHANTTSNNGGSGIGAIAGGGTGNHIHSNTSQGNGGFDLLDNNPNCDSNTWKQNTFGTANQTCIQ